MPFLSELKAVNLIRGSVGKAPVSTLNTTNPDIVAAQLRLSNTTTEVQAKSWWFNTELCLVLVPNIAGELIVPSNALEVRPNDPFTYLTARGTRVYDPINHTFDIGESVAFDLLVRLDFSELPYQAANHIQYDAARKFQGDFDGDPARIKDLRVDADKAWLQLREAEQRNRRPNALLSAGSLRMWRRVNPRASYSRNPIFPGG